MGSKRPAKNVVEVDLSKLDSLMDSSRVRLLEEDEANQVKKTLHALVAQLKPEFRNSEKLKDLFPPETEEASESKEAVDEKKKAPSHGRNGPAVFMARTRSTLSIPNLSLGAFAPNVAKAKSTCSKTQSHNPHGRQDADFVYYLRAGSVALQSLRRSLHGT